MTAESASTVKEWEATKAMFAVIRCSWFNFSFYSPSDSHETWSNPKILFVTCTL